MGIWTLAKDGLQKTQNAVKPVINFTASSFRWYGYGAWLTMLFFRQHKLFVLMSLSAHQVQYKIRQININDKHFSVAELKELNDKIISVEKKVDSYFDASAQIANQLDNSKGQLKSIRDELESPENIPSEARKKELQDLLTAEIAQYDKLICERIDASNLANVQSIIGVYTKNDLIEEYQVGDTLTDPNEGKLEPSYNITSCEFKKELVKIKVAERRIHPRMLEALDELSYLTKLQEKQIKPDYEDKKWHKKLTLWVGYNFKIWQHINFIAMTGDLLTIMVVMSMGALGSAIRLTRTYLKPVHDERFAHYVFLPVLGAVTAFSIYILAKAGVLIIADSNIAGHNTSLSPFFISFLGLISGMLSEEALNTIKTIAKKWFTNRGDGVERWGIGLEKKLEEKKVSQKDIANLVNLPEDTVKKWLNEEEAIPASKQQRIADWLQTSPRELFSDIPPKKVAPTPAS